MIHKFSINSIYFVMDINSGAVHVLDEKAYYTLDKWEKQLEAESKNHENTICSIDINSIDKDEAESLLELKQLIQQGELFSSDKYENILDNYKASPVIKALCLHAAHDCNLRCRYCFAGKGDYNGERSLMSIDVGKQAIDFLLTHSGIRKNLEIDFFGGEPTLNWKMITEVVMYAREREKSFDKNIRFTLTTNGLLLDLEKQNFINQHMHNVVLSLDGRKEINDRIRKTVGGFGSYNKVAPNFLRLAESREQNNYYVRGTFTRENLDFSADVLHLANMGFNRISVEPVVADEKEDYALREIDLPVIFKQYEILAQKMLEQFQNGHAFKFFHFEIDFSGGPCVYKRLIGCGAGTEYLAVTPNGDLYPCHQFVGMDNFKIGDLQNGITNENLQEKFLRCNVYAKKDCVACWAKFYCSGGCAANAFNNTGDLYKPYSLGCALQKKRIECAVYLAAAKSITEDS